MQLNYAVILELNKELSFIIINTSKAWSDAAQMAATHKIVGGHS